MFDDDGDAEAVFDLCEDEWPVAAHGAGIAIHDVQIGADGAGEIGFIDNQEVGLRDAGAAFAGDFVAAGDVDDVDGEIGKLAAEVSGQVVAAGFEQQQFGFVYFVQMFEGEEVGGDILADGCVGAAAGFDGQDAIFGQGTMTDEKFAVLAGEDVVGDSAKGDLFMQSLAESEHESGLAAADGAADADGKGAAGKIAEL